MLDVLLNGYELKLSLNQNEVVLGQGGVMEC